MANLFYIMGKSATGKDTVYKRIKEKIDINEYVLYTTRPKRDGEQEGVDYHYVDEDRIKEFEKDNKVIESRTYQTACGPWTYATINDKQLQKKGDILTVGTLESYTKIKEYLKTSNETKIIPIYITIDENERRKRALEREQKQKEPKFAEMERRLKADNIDFSEENLKLAGITKKETFENYDLNKCVNEILNYMENNRTKEVTKQIDKEISKNDIQIEDEER